MSDFDFGFAPPENPMDDYGPIDEEELLNKTLNNNFDNVDDLIDENKEIVEDKTEDKIDNKKEDKNNNSKKNINNKKKNKEPQNKNNKNQEDKNNKQTENKSKELSNKKPLYEQLIEEDVQDKDKDKDKDLNKIDEEAKDKDTNKDAKNGSGDKKEDTKNKDRKEKLKDMLKETTMIEDAPQEANKLDIEEVPPRDEQEDKEMTKKPIKTDKSVLDEMLEDISNTNTLEEDSEEKNTDINTEELKTKDLKPKRSISETSEEKSEEEKKDSEISSKNNQQNNEIVEKDKYKNEVIDDIRKQFEEEQKKNKQYVEEELEKREHKSPPPIESKFLANLVKNLEELFQNVRFYKMSQSTVYEKTLEKGLSVVDIILHFITSMMLGSGVMKLIQTYRMFGNLNGQIVSSYKRGMYGFFAFFFVVPILKMLLIGIFGTLINKRRDTEKDVYKEIFYHIIISSYAIIIPAIAFKLFVDINPQIAILILIPIIYLESSNLRNIINVSEILGIQTSFSVEFLSFITVYFLMLFSIIKYFYL